MYKEDDYLLISGVQHYVFCKRQWGLIHIERQWEDNYLTSGELMHNRVHDETLNEHKTNTLRLHAYPVYSPSIGITGCCDLIEGVQDPTGIPLPGKKGTWNLMPVEYKRGKPKVHDADLYQLCAQVLCLEEMHLCNISIAYLYYGQTHHRLPVLMDTSLRNKVLEIFQEMHEIFAAGRTPRIESTNSCKSCSLNNICMPQLNKTLVVSDYVALHIKDV